MALPTAQLGGMASLNVPSHIPTVVIPRQVPLWQQALASMLTQAGGAALGQGIQNFMSGEFAGEFGEAPVTGIRKFLTGPGIGEKEASQRRTLTAQKESDIRNIIAQGQRERLSQTEATNRLAAELGARLAGEENAWARTEAELKQRGDIEGIRARQHLAETRAQTLRQQIAAAHAEKLQRERFELDKPKTDAEIASLLALAARNREDAKWSERMNAGSQPGATAPGKKPINPNLRADVQREQNESELESRGGGTTMGVSSRGSPLGFPSLSGPGEVREPAPPNSDENLRRVAAILTDRLNEPVPVTPSNVASTPPPPSTTNALPPPDITDTLPPPEVMLQNFERALDISTQNLDPVARAIAKANMRRLMVERIRQTMGF
jgi:hypothetical protein